MSGLKQVLPTGTVTLFQENLPMTLLEDLKLGSISPTY